MQNSNFSCFVVGVIWGENIFPLSCAVVELFRFQISLSLTRPSWQPKSPFIFLYSVWRGKDSEQERQKRLRRKKMKTRCEKNSQKYLCKSFLSFFIDVDDDDVLYYGRNFHLKYFAIDSLNIFLTRELWEIFIMPIFSCEYLYFYFLKVKMKSFKY